MIDEVVIAHRDVHLLVLIKPSGLPTTSPTGQGCLTEIAHRLDPKAPRLHPTSRLDAEVTGLVTFARTEHATRTLLQARSDGLYGRRYLAIVTPPPTTERGTWSQSIAIDPRDRRRRTAQREDAASSQHARSDYRTLATAMTTALLCLSPHTGRTHQLRVHAEHAGSPIFGDRHYGGVTRFVAPDGRVFSARRVMLHCAALQLPNPSDRTLLTLRAPVPDDMRRLWIGLGGTEAQLDAELF